MYACGVYLEGRRGELKRDIARHFSGHSGTLLRFVSRHIASVSRQYRSIAKQFGAGFQRVGNSCSGNRYIALQKRRNMTQTPKPPSLREAYAARQPNEAEQQLAVQHAPGYIPPGWEQWAVERRLAMLPQSDPRRQLLARRRVNHAEMSDLDIKAIFATIT